MRVQRVEWHSYQLVYEYDIPDDDITDKYNTLEVFKEAIASDDEESAHLINNKNKSKTYESTKPVSSSSSSLINDNSTVQ